MPYKGEKGNTHTINKRDYTKDVIKRSDMKDQTPAYKPDERPKLSLYQQKVNLLDEEDKITYPSLGALMYLGYNSAPSISWRGLFPSIQSSTGRRTYVVTGLGVVNVSIQFTATLMLTRATIQNNI